MKNQLEDLLDIPRLQCALDSLYASSKIPSAIIDNDGKVHTGSGWQDVCTKFHRVHPEARKRCIESDTYIADHIREANPSITYKCPHGLVDAATPIIIEGEHIGNVFTGQLFLEAPDLDSFRAQAKAFGFDEETYIEAVNKVPIISEKAFQENLAFIAHLTGMLAEMGRKRAREKEAEKRLRESEERYRAVVEGLPDVVMRFDRDGRHLFVSDNVNNVVDLPVEQFIGKTHCELGFPEAQSRYWEEAIRGVFDSGAPYETEFTLEGKQGPVIFNWRLVPERDAQGMVQSVLSFKRDITEHRRAEEKLRQSEKKILESQSLLQAVVDGTTDAIYVKDLQGRYRLLNTAASRFTGKSSSEVIGNDDTLLFPADEARAVMEGDRGVIAAGKTLTYEDHLSSGEGEKVIFLSTKGPIVDECGRVNGLFRHLPRHHRAEAGRGVSSGERGEVSRSVRAHAGRMCVLQDDLRERRSGGFHLCLGQRSVRDPDGVEGCRREAGQRGHPGHPIVRSRIVRSLWPCGAYRQTRKNRDISSKRCNSGTPYPSTPRSGDISSPCSTSSPTASVRRRPPGERPPCGTSCWTICRASPWS